AGRRPCGLGGVAGASNPGWGAARGGPADVADRGGLWLPVEAASGAAARLSPRDAFRVPDLERAHSVTVDPHKWLFQGYDIGGLVVRDGSVLERTFGSRTPEYYRGGARRPAVVDGEKPRRPDPP